MTTDMNLCNPVQRRSEAVTVVVAVQINTFQAVLITDGWHSFVMLNYGNMTWTTGILSGGDPHDGIGGTAALVNKTALLLLLLLLRA